VCAAKPCCFFFFLFFFFYVLATTGEQQERSKKDEKGKAPYALTVRMPTDNVGRKVAGKSQAENVTEKEKKKKRIWRHDFLTLATSHQQLSCL
jgi:hypothetical protein